MNSPTQPCFLFTFSNCLCRETVINNAQRQKNISWKRVTSSWTVIYDTPEKKVKAIWEKKWYDELQEIVNYRKVYSLLLFHKSLETIVMR